MSRGERMLIELWRKETAEQPATTLCVICGNDFELGSVYARVTGDRGQEMGEMCPTCLEHLNRRKADAADPTLGNWPARDWPTSADLRSARARHPEPMFETSDELCAAAVDKEADQAIHDATIIWAMERERV